MHGFHQHFPVAPFRALALAGALLLQLAAGRESRADSIAVPDHFATIQAAIDAAFDGDEIVVSSGSYEERIDFLGKAITVRSSSGAEGTTIEDPGDPAGGASRSVVTFANGESAASVLDGFTISGGVGTATIGRLYGFEVEGQFGGGVYIAGASPTIRNCVIESNSAEVAGGGIYAEDSEPTLEDVALIGNESDAGGAIYFHGGALLEGRCSGCSLISNRAGDYGSGGGAFFFEPAECRIDGATIADNSAFIGGGLYLARADAAISGCTFDGNRADFAGAVALADSTALFDACTLIANEAGQGGGLLVDSGSRAALERTLLVRNRADLGACLHASSGAGSIELSHCTSFGNEALTGSLVYAPDGPGGTATSVTVALFDSIDWGNGADSIDVAGSLIVEYCCMEAERDGEGNLSSDPEFVDADGNDYRLQRGSPCIDAADPAAAPDADGSTADIGSLPFRASFRRGDANGDGKVDALVDAIFLLRWQFEDANQPLCEDAADVDDNGTISALIDAVRLLGWRYLGGASPPAPGVQSCGEDPVGDDSLDCEILPACGS